MEKSPQGEKAPMNVYQGLPKFAQEHGLITKIIETDEGWVIFGTKNKNKELTPDNADVIARGTTQWEAFRNFMEVCRKTGSR